MNVSVDVTRWCNANRSWSAAVCARLLFCAVLSWLILLSSALLLDRSAQAGQNPAITLSDNGTHIDRGVSYTNSLFLTASGGSAPYTFSVDPATPLPSGITVNADGTLTGVTCGSNGSYRLTVTATDSIGDYNSNGSLAIIVNRAPAGGCTLTFSPSSLPDGVTGTSYSQTVSASGSSGTVTYSLASGSLPPGLTLNTSTGTISGTPTTTGTYTFTILASDTSGNTGSQTYTVNITSPSITVNPSSLPNGTQGVAYSQTVSASGGTAPYTYSVDSGSLPAGLSLVPSTGVISGTPTGSGASTFTIRATDTNSNSGTRTYTVNIGTNSLTVNPASLPNGTQGTAYSQTVSASGGTGPYTFAVTSGSLPAGLTLNIGTGAITGTPTTGGSYTFTIQATDSVNNTGSRSYTVYITTNSLTVNPATLPNGTLGTAYSQTVSVSGGTAPYTFAVTSGALPTGLSLNGSSGAITGTPTAVGSYTFTIQATDVNGNFGSRSYTVTISTITLTVSPATLPNGTQGSPYSQTVSASGGTGPYTFAVTSGSLPTGLSLDGSTGAITGTPTATGPFVFTIRATDSVGNTGSRSYNVSIGTNSLTVNPATLPNGTVGFAYSQTVSASGGTGPYTFSIAAGALPAGLSLDANTGAITGTPTSAGLSTFTIQATDSLNNIATRSYSVNIGTNSLTVNPPTLPNGTQGTPYSQTISASGGNGPYSFIVTSGSLPPSMSLDGPTGQLSGTPSGTGTFTFTVRATDSVGNIGSRSYTVDIGTSSLVVNPATLPNGTDLVPYSQTVFASGGTAPYSYAIIAGSLPPGLSLNAGSGVISGTPTNPGTYNFTVQATDATTNTASRAYTVNIGTNSLTVDPSSLPNGTQGIAYSQTISATGGNGPYTFTLSAGSLPAGLSLNANSGVISGTPTGSGVSNFTVQATDTLGNIGNRAYTVSIGTGSLTVNPASLPAGTQGIAYSQTVSASGGTGPYTFTLSAGSLPAGLSLNANSGAISGTPTGSGSSSFTIRATDTLGNIGSRPYTISIGTVSLTINPATLPAAMINRSYSQTLTATGGTAPYTFTLISGSLPPGLTLSSGGLISGTPTSIGQFTFTVQALDPNGNIGTRTYTLFPVRPDPATDPEVIGMITAQIELVRRFSTTQVTNVTRHLESLHDRFDPCSFDFGISFPRDRALPYQTEYQLPYRNSSTVGALPYDSPAAQVARRMPDQQECKIDDGRLQIAFWTAGAVEIGMVAPNGAVSTNRLSTAGLTAGADVKLMDGLVVGFAVGYGTGRSDVGLSGTRTDGTSVSGMIYASYKPFNPWFIDAVLGFGTLGYDNSRWISVDNTTAASARSGTFWFGSLGTSIDMKYDALKIAPYVRAEFLSVALRDFTEQSSSSLALSYGALRFSSVTGVLGVRGSYDIPMNWGVLAPTARLEYRQLFDGAYQQAMYYTDLGPSMTSVLSQAAVTRSSLGGAVGLRARSPGGLTAEVEYGASTGGGALWVQSVRGALRLPF